MRLLGEIIIIGALLYIGWEIPFRDRFPVSVSGVGKSKTDSAASAQAQPRPFARSTSTPSAAWMWDPNRHTVLDRPNPKQPTPH